ncbi:MAG: helix-turn-helix transcriptional regulator [Atopobiaceae bacterium]|nr:helix-turn-helix transcriptional regulator [Atopobiaceae bacterium]
MSDTRRNISRLRRLSGMTQDDFARIAGVSRSAVAQWERGGTEPRMGAIQRLSDYFRIPKAWIIEDGGMDGVQMAAGVLVKSESNGLTDSEGMLLDLFRSMSIEGQNALIASARGLAMAYPKKKEDL